MRLSNTFALLLAGVAGFPAFAQVPDTGDANDAGDREIIVTAQKRAERASDVPITLSVATAARMRELGVSDLDELAFYVPGLNIQEQNANNPGIVIRGITLPSRFPHDSNESSVNVRAGVCFDDRFEIAAFARNLLHRDYLLDAGNTGGAFGIPSYIPAEPRLYGIQPTARF